jgi:hypothetical protein
MEVIMKLALVLLVACIPVTATSAPSPSASPAPDRWFVAQGSATTGPQLAFAAVATANGWTDEAGKPLPTEYSHGMRTQPAAASTIKWGRPVIATCSGRWWLLVARSVDERANTIEVGRDGNNVCPTNVAIANVRVIVEFKTL